MIQQVLEITGTHLITAGKLMVLRKEPLVIKNVKTDRL